MGTKVVKDDDLLARARQTAMLNHAEVIIRALLMEDILEVGINDDGDVVVHLTRDGIKWYDRANYWLEELGIVTEKMMTTQKGKKV